MFMKKDILFHNRWLIPTIIILIMILGLWLRLASMPFVLESEVPKLIFMDSWYNMRQIEQMVVQFPGYAWYDPMTNYPFGKINGWGPLFPMICSAICILTGSLTRPDIMVTASFIPPLLGICMIPVLFFIGKTVSDIKTGLFSAFIIAILSGECLYRSFFGYVDHQVTEVLFSSLFVLAYISMLLICQKKPIETLSFSGIQHILLPSVLAGFLYFLAVMNSTTTVLFGLLIAFFILIWMVISHFIHKDRLDFVIGNCITFGLFSILFFFFGIHEEGFSLHYYTQAHIVAALIIIAETLFLYLISRGTRKQPFFIFAGVLVGLSIIGSFLFAFLFPALFNQFSVSARIFFLLNYDYMDIHINEMGAWSLDRAITSFHLTLVLFAGGILVLLTRLKNQVSAGHLFILIWGILMVLATVMHVRYEYYAAVPVCLFSGLFLSWIISSGDQGKNQAKQKRTLTSAFLNKKIRYGIVAVILVIVLVLSVQTIYKVADQDLAVISINDDWVDALTWFENNSPDTGVDYTRIYDQETFVYPEESYGVFSWWDYGHWITFLSKRIPLTNPFQKSADHAAAYFTRTSEKKGEPYIMGYGGRYVITDYRTATGLFPGIVDWAYINEQNEDYQKILYLEKEPGVFQPITHLRQPFYESILIRLHFFDGSYTPGQGGLYVEHADMTAGSSVLPVITKSINIGPEAVSEIQEKAKDPVSAMPGAIFSIIYPRPIEDVSALTHYRLIYESPTSPESSGKSWDVKQVKIFQHVDGYEIKGKGTIELPLITNQGRNFSYIQKSADGRFLVPYSTKDNPYQVHATGPYRILETGETFEVYERDIHPVP